MAETIARRENANGLQAFVTVGRFLEQEGWHPQQMEDTPIYQMSFSAVTGTTQAAFDGIQVGTLLPDGQAITITLGVFDDTDRDLATQVFEEIRDGSLRCDTQEIFAG